MIIANHKPIRIIGYPEASMAADLVDALHHHGPEIMLPVEFFDLNSKDQYQYIVPHAKDLAARMDVISILDSMQLDLVTVIHDTVVLPTQASYYIGAGSFIGAYTSIGVLANIGRHTMIGPYSLVGHYSSVGHNTQMRPGSMIIGKSQVGSNCLLHCRVTVTNTVKICDHVELLAFSEVRKSITQSGTYGGKPVRKIFKS